MKIIRDVSICYIKNTAVLLLHSYHLSSDSYLIGFDDSLEGITETVNHLRRVLPRLKIQHTFQHLNAVAVSAVSISDLHLIQSFPDVAHIEPNYFVEAMRVQRLENETTSWGIDRIDGKLDDKYHYTYTGKGVRVYIVDSGIQVNHDEFNVSSNKNATNRRAKCGKNLRYDLVEKCNDQWGHGTHVAGIIGTSI